MSVAVAAPKTRTTTRPVDIVAKVKNKGLDEVGFVDRKGLARIKRGVGKVDVFFADRVSRGATVYARRLFLSTFMEVVEKLPKAERVRVSD